MIAIPGYTIVEEIGRGGMATVFRARQAVLDRDVALKVLSPALTVSTAHAERFLQEARLLAALEHPNIVRVFEVGVSPDGLHYFSMQLLTGGDLGRRLAEGMSEADLVRVLACVAAALGFAHDRGYVHRDVTPANILFDLHDEPVLTDFGIARVMSAASRLTPTGLSIGTGRYMSPEQAQGGEVDHRSDIYSLGVVTYEALSGHLPFEGDDAFSIAMAHVTEPVPPLPEECARWQPLIDGALAKAPEDRYANTTAFLHALQRAAPECFPRGVMPAGAPLPRAVRGGARERRRPRLPYWAWPAGGATLLALLMAGIVWALWPAADESSTAPRAAGEGAARLRPPSEEARRPDLEAAMAEVPAATPGLDAATAAAEVAPAAAQAVAGDPAQWPTVEDPVPRLLAAARGHLAAQRLTIPPGENAFDAYTAVLRLSPGEPDAVAGLAAVADAYLALADALDPETAGEEWRQMLERAERVAQAHPAAVGAAEGAQQRRRARAAVLVDRAGDAAAAWDRDRALALYREALALDPAAEGARAGLSAAERIGRRGFTFNDPLSGDGAGPTMVVLDGIAMSRTEVTVADFRRWWDAAGAARFSASMPQCRDRERGFMFSSARRTWQKPDVPVTDVHPVVCVSFAMAQDYADWLSQRSGARYRLPTAGEWRAARGSVEPACEAANRRDAAYRRSFGGRDGGACDDGFPSVAPVARFAAREPGLYDLDGNVREWVSDCGTGGCGERLALGGAWLVDDDGGGAFDADRGTNSIGIRLVREWTGEPRPATSD